VFSSYYEEPEIPIATEVNTGSSRRTAKGSTIFEVSRKKEKKV
jgi:hypothetical protein